MPATATMAPSNRHKPTATAPAQPALTPAAAPEWAMRQAQILRDAGGDAPKAFIDLCAASIEHIAEQDAEIHALHERILALQQSPIKARLNAPWAPRILAWMEARSEQSPISVAELTAAFQAPYSLGSKLREMVRNGQLVRVGDLFALPAAAATATPAKAAPAARVGRTKKASP